MARRQWEAEALSVGLTPDVLDQVVAGVQTPADFQIVWRQLQKAMAERVLQAEKWLRFSLRPNAGGWPTGGRGRLRGV